MSLSTQAAPAQRPDDVSPRLWALLQRAPRTEQQARAERRQ